MKPPPRLVGSWLRNCHGVNVCVLKPYAETLTPNELVLAGWDFADN